MLQADGAGRILAEDGPAGKRLVLRLTDYEGSRLLDLRYWYQDKASQTFKPTGKGVSLTRKNFDCVKGVIEGRTEEILDWFSIGYVPGSVAAYEQRQADRNAELRLEAPDAKLQTNHEAKDTAFFHVTRSGGEATVVLNQAHPFVAQLLTAIAPEQAEVASKLIAQLLLCHAQAQDSLADAPATHSSILLDQLQHNWSELLRRSASRR